jgi:acetylornithine/N-succinyldiaminopimelate aminotransferase
MQVIKNKFNKMDLVDREKEYLFHTYKRIPIEIIRGKGVYLYSKEQKKYLDMFGGLAVNALGYGNKNVIKAIHTQTDKYIHLSNYFLQEPQIELAEKLIKHTGYKNVFFTNSGTESIEGAIKISRKWGVNKNKNNIISFTNSFHGRTFGALSLMDRSNYKEGFGPFLENFSISEYNNATELKKTVNNNTLAVVLEFIQGEGGIVEASENFVNEIRSLKNKFGFLIIADEIQSGLGRTGKMFAFQHYNINPDIVVIAKPLGGGLPLGAILGNENVAEILQPGNHGTTFGGNPVACAAGIVVLTEIVENGVIENAKLMGNLLKSKLVKLKVSYPTIIAEVRGKGLMVGVELTQEGDSIVTAMRDRGVLINCTNNNVLRFLPPLVIREEHIEKTIKELDEEFKKTAPNK